LRRRSTQLILLAFFFPASLFSQDSTDRRKIIFDLSVESKGGQHYYNPNAGVLLPHVIKQIRRNGISLPVSLDTITDNPFRHGALYAVVKQKHPSPAKFLSGRTFTGNTAVFLMEVLMQTTWLFFP